MLPTGFVFYRMGLGGSRQLSGGQSTGGGLSDVGIVRPRRWLRTSKASRWRANLGVVLLDTLVVRYLFVTGAVAAAMTAGEHGWGLVNQWPGPGWLKLAVAVIALDLALYLQQWCFMPCRSSIAHRRLTNGGPDL
jgi:hypothetical protein